MRIVLYAAIFTLFIGCDSQQSSTQQTNKKLAVCATTTDIGSLVKIIGGDQDGETNIQMLTCCKGEEDPHYVNVTPSYSKFLNNANLLIHLGFGCESGWLPDLLNTVERKDLQMENEHNVDLSKNVRLLDPSLENKDEGSVHEGGNPHYLLDPMEGIKAAKTICDKFSKLRPKQQDVFEKNYQEFRYKIAAMLVGEKLAKKYEIEKLAMLFEQGKLENFLKTKNHAQDLGGHFALIAPYRGTKVVGDHDLWPYFARQYGIVMAEYIEVSPGIPPTTQHLQKLIAMMKKENITAILCNPSFNIRHSKFVAEQSGGNLVPMAHQPQSRPNTDDYIATMEYNFKMLYNALKDSKK